MEAVSSDLPPCDTGRNAQRPEDPAKEHGLRSVAVVVGSRVAGFELGILCQVFGLDRSDDGLPSYDFTVCGPRPGLVRTTSGFAVEVTHGLDRVAAADLVAVPAWPDLDAPLDPDIAMALRAAHERGADMLAVCTGAFALAGAGVLDGRRATTHWQFTDRLVRRFPRVRVERDVLYVTDGSVVTSAGAAAGIDACLHVVRRAHGSATANALARRMVVPAHRDGGQAQYVELPLPRMPAGNGLADVLDWAVGHLDRPLTVDTLAARARMSSRSFARHFRATTGTTPHRWLLEQRLQRAELLLETTDLTIDVVAQRSGFGSADTLRHHFARRRGTTPNAHRHAFRT
jgi:transcriptional regulator GlxA family with amidase domain